MTTPAGGGVPPKVPGQKPVDEHIDFGKAKAKFGGRTVIKPPKIEHDQGAIPTGAVAKAKETQRKIVGMKEQIPGLGSQPKDSAPGMSDRVQLHRHPTININDYMTAKIVGPQTSAGTEPDFRSHFLTDIRDYKLKKWLEGQPASAKDDLRLIAKMKEQFNQEAYEQYLNGNVNDHLYEPGAIAAEMKAVLKFNDEAPFAITDIDSAQKAIAKELQSFRIAGTNKKIFSEENIKQLCSELVDVMKLYQEVYPDKTIADMYVLTRDMARVAAYQMNFDKGAFTGSDHGVLHIFHNCEHGHHMHEEMSKHGDSDKKVDLLGKIVHFYHDIGYSVGSATHFDVMKDHPFVGAAFIRENKDYFGRLLGPDEAKIIENSILNHAIVSFDSDTTNAYKMIRFTTSNSDACAVTADQKTQTFWRDHPETLLELARMRMFITIFPETGAVLGNSKIIRTPEEAMKSWLKEDAYNNAKQLRQQDKTVTFTAQNFKDPVYYNAWLTYSSVKDALLKIAAKEDLPQEEREAFKQAILENFNAFGGDVVLKQFGAELHDVSVRQNPKWGQPNEPKYLPAIKLGPSTLAAYLESCFSSDISRGNIKKLAVEEYGAKKNDINAAVDEVGQTNGPEEKEVKTSVAVLTIKKAKHDHPQQLNQVVSKLEEIHTQTVPITVRQKLNEYIDVISPKENKGKGNDFKDGDGRPLVKIGNEFYLANWQTEYGLKFNAISTMVDIANLSDDAFDNFINAATTLNAKLSSGDPSKVSATDRLMVRNLLTADKDWDVMKLTRS